MENQVENLPQLVSKHESEGQHDSAVQLCKKTLCELKQAKGNDHSDLAKVFKILEQVYLNQISYNESKFGPNNHKVSVTLTELGDLYYELKKFGDAQSVYRRALVITENIYKENDPEIEKVLWRLAYACRHQEKYDEAEFYLKDSLKICERIGPPEVARRTLDLGNLYLQKGELKAAEQTYNEALKIFTIKLRSRDLLVGHTKYNLAKCLAKQGRFKEAEPYLKEASFIYEDKEEFLQLADARLGLGCCFLDQDKFKESKKYLQSALSLLTKPPQDPKTLKVADVYFNLGVCFSGRTQIKKAESAYSHAVNIYTEKLGENNLQLAKPMFNLANCLMARRQHKKAEEYLLRLLKLHKKNPVIGKLKAEDTKCCLVMCLTKQGRYQEAYRILKEAAIRQENLNLATIKFNLGNSFLDAGDYEKSMKLYHEALSIFEKQPRNDLMVADTKYNLALALTQLNRMEEAQGFYLGSLSLYSKELKPNDTHLCNVKINLGNCYLKLEQWQEAQENYLGSLQNCKSGSGEDGDAEFKNIIALCFYKQERYKEAQDYYTMVLEIYENGSGANDSDVAEVKKNIALCSIKQKRFEEALEYFRAFITFYEGNSATDELRIADIKCNIAECLSKQGNRIGAVEYYESSLANYEKIPICLNFAHAKYNIGYEYRLLKKWDIAEKWHRESLKLYRSLPGDMNEDVANAFRFLGYCLRDQGKYKDAEESSREALEIYEKHLKETDELIIADIKNDIAECLSKQGNKYGALEYYESACAHYERRPICLNFAHAKYNIGNQYRLLETWDIAEKWFRESLELYRSLPGDVNEDVAKAFRFLGYCLRDQGKHRDAEESYRESLEIYEKHVKDTDELIIAYIKHDIAWCLSKQGNRIGAVEYYKSACANYEKRPICLLFAHAKYNIGDEYRLLEKWDMAEKWYRESLDLYRSLPGDMNQDVAKSLRFLGYCIKQQGKHKVAEESYRESLEIYVIHLEDKDESIIANIKFNIAWCLSQQGNRIEAVEYYESACVNYEKRPICLDFAHAKHNIGREYFDLKIWDIAEEWLREGLELYRSLPGDRNWDLANSLKYLGKCLKQQGKHKDAEESFREGLERFEKYLCDNENDHWIIATSKSNIAKFFIFR